MSDSNSKEKILATALEIFSSKGFEGCGVNEIAEKSGVTKPTLYYFFTNKEGLYKAIWQENFDPFLEKLVSVSLYEANPSDYYKDVFPCLCRVAKSIFYFAKSNKTFFLHAMSSFASPDTVSTSQINREYYGKICEVLQTMFAKMGNAHGGIKGRDFQLAVTFLGLVTSYVTCWNLHGDALDEKSVESLVRQFMHGIF